MKKIYTFILFSVAFAALAQCPPGSVSLTTQAQVNAFAANYPNCHNLTGDIDIHGSDITSLAPLSGIQSVSGHLWVYLCPALPSLDGLGNIASVGALDVSYNSTLSDITALGSLVSIPGNLSVQSNPVLVSLAGLHHITTIGGYLAINGDGVTNLDGLSALTAIGFFLEIKNNPALVSADGLSNVAALANNGYLEVSGNSQLTTLQGLNNINPATINAFVISNNPQLSFCSIPNICQHLSSIGGGTVTNNATGCNTGTEVLALCSLGTQHLERAPTNVWPNPAAGIVHFDTAETIVQIEVFDSFGRRVFTGTQPKADLSGHAAGLYLYRITTDNGHYNGQLLLK